MNETDKILDALDAKNKKLQTDYAKTLAQIEFNKQRYIDAMETLKELGCDSVEEAEGKINQLNEEIQQELQDIVVRLK